MVMFMRKWADLKSQFKLPMLIVGILQKKFVIKRTNFDFTSNDKTHESIHFCFGIPQFIFLIVICDEEYSKIK